MSKWWGVGEEGDEEVIPPLCPPEYRPPMRYENKSAKTRFHLGRPELPKNSKSQIVRRIRIRLPISLHRLVRRMKDSTLM